MKFFSRVRPLLVGSCIGALAALGLVSGLFETWSAQVSDRLFLPHSPDASIVVVAIDDTSINQIGQWPWPRQVHGELIRVMKEAGARVIGYDVNFPEATTDENDQALANAVRDAANVVLPLELRLKVESGRSLYDPDQVLAPITSIRSVAAATGHSNAVPDSDGVVRRMPLEVYASTEEVSPLALSALIPSFVGEITRLAGHEERLDQAPLDHTGHMLVNFPGAPFRTFHTISAVDVLRHRVKLDALNGAVVFVGSTAADLHDALLAPTSNGLPMPGVEIHASAYDTLVGGHWLQEVPSWILALILILSGLFIAIIMSYFRARWSVPITMIVWLGFVIVAFILFDRGWILDLVWPSVTIALAAAAVTLERQITADLERRALKNAFSRYVSSSVVESLLQDPSKLKLGGDRKRMTVLFSDIRGFTTISEGLTPEQLVEILNRYLNRMTNIVFEHQGVLDKYIGDAVMAFWNAPFDQADHALRGVRTALAMRDALDEMNRTKSFEHLELHIGLGINTGDMVVGNVGGETRFDYTVIGDNVNLGSRLESLTKEYGVMIIVSESTRSELQDQILTRRIDKVAVKGKKEPVVIYEAMENMSEATSAQKKLAKDTEQALELYFSKYFAGAITLCEAILKKHPTDGPTKLLVERAQHFMQEPPPEGWIGTWVYTKK